MCEYDLENKKLTLILNELFLSWGFIRAATGGVQYVSIITKWNICGWVDVIAVVTTYHPALK